MILVTIAVLSLLIGLCHATGVVLDRRRQRQDWIHRATSDAVRHIDDLTERGVVRMMQAVTQQRIRDRDDR